MSISKNHSHADVCVPTMELLGDSRFVKAKRVFHHKGLPQTYQTDK